MSFQTAVNYQPGLGVAGDFASLNPFWTYDAGVGALVAGSTGVTVGKFAWLNPDGRSVSNSGSGQVAGFIGRAQQALITTYLAEATMLVPAGFSTTVYTGGDFLAKNDGSGSVTVGMKAYANYATGAVSFAATGTPPSGGVTTGSIAAGSGSVTASIAVVNNGLGQQQAIMTVTAVGSGSLVAGAILSGSGVVTGTTVLSQLTGTAGGVGTYLVSTFQTVASTTVSASFGVLTVTAVSSGSLAVGDVLSGANVTAGTVITQLGTGTGGTGTYYVQTTQTAASATVNATGAVETKWYAVSAGVAGDLIKISSQALG